MSLFKDSIRIKTVLSNKSLLSLGISSKKFIKGYILIKNINKNFPI